MATQEQQYLDLIAEARSFLDSRGMVFGRDYVESTAVRRAGELMLTEGFGPSTFRLEAA